jgi:CelD/BcsL family acetyltransferase involved in cellulose biosynthesis
MAPKPPATLARAMRSVVHDDPSAFSALVGPWRELLGKDPAASVFHTPQYLAVWWSEFGAGAELRVIEVLDGETLRGIVAAMRRAEGVFGFAGERDSTDYRGPVSTPEDRDAVAGAVLDSVAGDDWRVFEMEGLAADSGWPEAFSRAAGERGFAVSQSQTDPCPRVAIPGSWDAYMASLTGKLRHEINRKARRLERDAGPYTVRMATEETLDDDLDAFFEMHRSSDGPKGRFMHEGMATFFGSFAWMLFSQGWLRLATLEVEGEPWAGVYGFRSGSDWDVWNSAYDHRRRELSPGMVLMGDCIRLAAEEGCATFDFLRGTEPYKYRFGAVDMPLIRLEVNRV